MNTATHQYHRETVSPATYEAWRRDLARFVMAQGLRPLLEHIPPDDWISHYQCGDAPADAALDEVIRTQ